MRNSFYLLPLAVISSLSASAYNLKPDALLRIPVHCGGLLRLAVKGDRIKDVVTYPKSFIGVDVHKSGQLYIHTKSLPQTIQISLITQGGVTQDIQFYCSKVALEPIILEPEVDADGYKDGKLLEDILKKALKGELKYGTSITRDKSLIRKQEHLQWKPKEQWIKDKFIIRRYEALNESAHNIFLNAASEKQPDDLAVAFDQETIRPHQKAQMVVALKNPLEALKDNPQLSSGDNNEESIH